MLNDKINVLTNLGSIFFVEVSREDGKWDVDDNEGKDRCPNRYVFYQLIAEVVEHRRKVDCVDRSHKPSSETTEQVTTERHALRGR